MSKKHLFRKVVPILFVFVAASSWTISDAIASFHLEPATLSIIAPGPSGSVLPEIAEFATTVLHDPWDMKEPNDLAFFRMGLDNAKFMNGIFSGQMQAADGSVAIRLLTAGAPNHAAMRIGRNGYNYPIDANHYRYLTFRMYSGNSYVSSGFVQWFYNDTQTMGGRSQFFSVPANSWTTYVIDLQDAVPAGSWAGIVRELFIHPMGGAGVQGAYIALDWARLTAADPRTARPVTIQWTADEDGGTVALYASPNGQVLDAEDILIASGLSDDGGTYTFQTGVLPAGTYYIAARNNVDTAWSAGPITINAPPQVAIIAPSMTSGQDYAATELGGLWDMNSVTDINYDLLSWEQASTCVASESFSNSIYSAQVLGNCPPGSYYSDPILYIGRLNRGHPGLPDPTIDTTKYRYLSYRFYHSGEQNISEGWISRFGWWQVDGYYTTITQPPILSRDIMISEGWNIYNIDLWASDVIDEAYPADTPTWRQSQPNRLRFDPDELASSLAPATIQLDYIRLTTMDTVKQGNPFPIQYAVTGTLPMTLSFYYTTDPANVGTLIGTTVKTSANSRGVDAVTSSQVADTPPLTATYQVYLPSVMRNFLNCGETCFAWNTTDVDKDAYYVCINAQDAYNATYQCSEAPVVVSEAED
jgi:hypothetical protein